MVNSMTYFFTILQIVGKSSGITNLSRDLGIGSRSQDLEFPLMIIFNNFSSVIWMKDSNWGKGRIGVLTSSTSAESCLFWVKLLWILAILFLKNCPNLFAKSFSVVWLGSEVLVCLFSRELATLHSIPFHCSTFF